MSNYEKCSIAIAGATLAVRLLALAIEILISM